MNTIYNVFTGISEGSFGINTDIFETNIINLAIFVGGLYVVGSKAFGEILLNRQQRVVSAIQGAEEAPDRRRRGQRRATDADGGECPGLQGAVDEEPEILRAHY